MSRESNYWLVFIGTWKTCVGHIYHGTKLVAHNYLLCLRQGLFLVWKMIGFWYRGLFLGITTRMLSHQVVSSFFKHKFVNYPWSLVFKSTNIWYGYSFSKIHLPGGTGKDGRRRLTGWLCKVSICLWHLLGRNLSGKKYLRYISPSYCQCTLN